MSNLSVVVFILKGVSSVVLVKVAVTSYVESNLKKSSPLNSLRSLSFKGDLVASLKSALLFIWNSVSPNICCLSCAQFKTDINKKKCRKYFIVIFFSFQKYNFKVFCLDLIH